MKKITLNGKWSLKPSNSEQINKYTQYFETNSSVDMVLPGDIHSSLLAKKIIPDPYFDQNEINVQWVGKNDWICERTINISKGFLVGQQFITLNRADTFFKVFVNDVEAGHGNNMFRRWRFNITGLLTLGSNTIKITFDSAEKHAFSAAKRLPYPIPTSEYPICSPHRNLVRKVQCHSGWDWGPCLMVSGIYDDILLEQTTKGFIDYVTTRMTCDGDDWQVEVTTWFNAIIDKTLPVTVKIEGPNISPVISGTPVKVKVGDNTITHTLTVHNPQLWWPSLSSPQEENHLVSQKSVLSSVSENPLYTLSVMVSKSTFSKKIAFRTLEVISEKDDAGRSLFFKVNGKPIFSKGVNWIPCDALPSRQTHKKYESLLRDVVKANMNTIRLWGGGQYEDDYFYELCDRFGILIWHDCMFACSMYPATPTFLENVRKEIRHQVLRLKDHPSIALWCGNNEDLGALTWYEESKQNRDRYIIDYDRLNEGVIGSEIRKYDPDRLFWSSSPSAGPNDYSDNWHHDGCGDMHFWSVWHEKKSFDAYLSIKPRFVSEFGYESFPSLDGVKQYSPDNQLNLTSPVMEFHQRSPSGNSIILENFSRYFRFPSSFVHMLYLSQVQQALAIKTAVEYWRSLRPYCMGSLIWQLNDVWPVASWSSIEYSGKWKLLHYEAANFFAPITIVQYIKDGIIYACTLNDTDKEIVADISFSVVTFDGSILETEKFNKVLKPQSAEQVFTIDVCNLPTSSSNCFLFAEMTYNGVTRTHTLFPSKPKECELLPPDISFNLLESTKLQSSSLPKVSIDSNLNNSGFLIRAIKYLEQNSSNSLQIIDNDTQGKSCFVIELTTKYPAFYVSLDAEKLAVQFSDNMFTLLPGVTHRVICTTSKSGISATRLTKALKITSLRDTY